MKCGSYRQILIRFQVTIIKLLISQVVRRTREKCTTIINTQWTPSSIDPTMTGQHAWAAIWSCMGTTWRQWMDRSRGVMEIGVWANCWTYSDVTEGTLAQPTFFLGRGATRSHKTRASLFLPLWHRPREIKSGNQWGPVERALQRRKLPQQAREILPICKPF